MDASYRHKRPVEVSKTSNLLDIKGARQKPDALAQGFQEAAADLASIIAEDEALVPNQQFSKKALQERYQKQIEEEFAGYRKRLDNGAAKLIQSMIELSKDDPEILSQEVLDGINRIIGLSDIIAKDEEGFANQIFSGVSLQELAHVSNATINKLYQGARRLFDQKLFDDAADAFVFLTSLNSKQYLFWFALGNCEYCLKRYKEALDAYAFACEINPNDPTCFMISSRCYAELSEIDNAIKALDAALSIIDKSHEFDSWKGKLENEKKRLEQIKH